MRVQAAGDAIAGMDGWDDVRAFARRIWGWPVAILLGFPIAGLVADLIVDGVDSAGAALVGGAVAGAIFGAAQ